MLTKLSAWFATRWATLRTDDRGDVLERVVITVGMMGLALLVLAAINAVVDGKLAELANLQ